MRALADSLLVDIGDETIEVDIRRSETARTTRIQVGSDVRLRVVVPAGASDDFAEQAILAKASWVRRKLDELAAADAFSEELGLRREGVIWLAGDAVDIVRGPVRFARLADGGLTVPNEGDVQTAIVRFYRREARRRLRQLVAEQAEQTELHPRSVVVRDQRTRWGSCSRGGQLSLNWRLVISPAAVARYVVVHELCHLRVASHSKPFWRLLGQHCADWQEPAEWLRRHGEELRRYKPPEL